MHVEAADGEWLWRHVGVQADGSMVSVDGQHVQDNALAEDVDGVLGPCVQVIVVTVVFHD